MITSKPIQAQGLEATDPTDHLIDHPSEKIENENVSDCVKFICAAIYSKISAERSDNASVVWGTCDPQLRDS